jgi:hypothetical protein
MFRDSGGGAPPQALRSDAIEFEIEDVVPFGIETGEARIAGIFHPVASD